MSDAVESVLIQELRGLRAEVRAAAEYQVKVQAVESERTVMLLNRLNRLNANLAFIVFVIAISLVISFFIGCAGMAGLSAMSGVV